MLHWAGQWGAFLVSLTEMVQALVNSQRDWEGRDGMWPKLVAEAVRVCVCACVYVCVVEGAHKEDITWVWTCSHAHVWCWLGPYEKCVLTSCGPLAITSEKETMTWPQAGPQSTAPVSELTRREHGRFHLRPPSLLQKWLGIMTSSLLGANSTIFVFLGWNIVYVCIYVCMCEYTHHVFIHITLCVCVFMSVYTYIHTYGIMQYTQWPEFWNQRELIVRQRVFFP